MKRAATGDLDNTAKRTRRVPSREPTEDEQKEFDEIRDLVLRHDKHPLYKFVKNGYGGASPYDTLKFYAPDGKAKFDAGLHQQAVDLLRAAQGKSAVASTNDAHRALQIASYSPTPPADGELQIRFVNVGTGDCIMIRTPGGNTLVVDAGSVATPASYLDMFAHATQSLKLFLGDKSDGKPNRNLYALILTHPDQDHYNLAKSYIQGCADKILYIFHSLPRSRYAMEDTNDAINGWCTGGAAAKEVRIRTGVVGFFENDVLNATNATNCVIGPDTIQILGQKPPLTPPDLGWTEPRGFEVHLLAGGVGGEHNANSGNPNPCSVVVLIKVHGRKILLTGDAETTTEDFMLTSGTRKALLKDVDLLHLEHHGSDGHHGSDAFIKTVNPQVVVSSNRTMHGHPRWNVIERYLKGKRLRNVESHVLEYGVTKEKRSDNKTSTWTKKHSTKAIYSTQSSGDLLFKVSRDGLLTRTWTQGGEEYGYSIDAAGAVTAVAGTKGIAVPAIPGAPTKGTGS